MWCFFFALALTPVTPNLILTARILDKANQNAVLYERQHRRYATTWDPSLTEAEQQAVSGIAFEGGERYQAPPWTSGAGVLLNVFQYNYDGMQRRHTHVRQCELWTYRVPIQRCVDAQNAANPLPPYTTWATAARVIQDAWTPAERGDEIVVTNATYATGGHAGRDKTCWSSRGCR